MYRVLKWYEKTLLYGCLGLAAEVVFTSFAHPSWSLIGYSYTWMLIVWASGIFTMGFTHKYINEFNIIVRALIYMMLCFFIEYAFGMLFKYTLGGIPWDYSNDTYWHISGAIRLDYAPIWAIAGLIGESIVNFTNRIIIAHED